MHIEAHDKIKSFPTPNGCQNHNLRFQEIYLQFAKCDSVARRFYFREFIIMQTNCAELNANIRVNGKLVCCLVQRKRIENGSVCAFGK